MPTVYTNRHPLRLLVLGFGLGAVGLFLMDPSSGARRRHRVHRRVNDFRNRLRGFYADVKSSFELEVEVDNKTLVERVRAQFGRAMRRAHDVQVEAEHGTVTLTGKVWEDEVEAVIEAVERVPGVKDICDLLTIRQRQKEEHDGERSHG